MGEWELNEIFSVLAPTTELFAFFFLERAHSIFIASLVSKSEKEWDKLDEIASQEYIFSDGSNIYQIKNLGMEEEYRKNFQEKLFSRSIHLKKPFQKYEKNRKVAYYMIYLGCLFWVLAGILEHFNI